MMKRRRIEKSEVKGNKRLYSLTTMILLSLILLILSSSGLGAHNYVYASSLGTMPSPPSTPLVIANSGQTNPIIQEEFTPGTAIQGEYVVTLKNESVPIVRPSSVPSPTALVLQSNETALTSSIQYLESNQIETLGWYNFNESGVALVIKTPDPVSPVQTAGGPGVSAITPGTAGGLTVANVKRIFAGPQPAAFAAPTSLAETRTPLTNTSQFCQIAMTSNIETCEVNRRGSVSAGIALPVQTVPTGVQRIGAYKTSSTLQSGSSGPEVTRLQETLKSNGFDPGPIDGKFGPMTLAAVKQFQTSKGLAADGIVGPLTWKALLSFQFQNANVAIVVMDTGVAQHSDLNLNPVLSKSFIGDDKDNWNHGTHVAGIAAGIDNAFGIRGVAPGADIISVKVLDPLAPNRPGGTSTFLAGIEYITQLARTTDKKIVVNLSITLGAQSPALDRAISQAVKEGVVFVAAAGNSAVDAASAWPGSVEPNDAIVVSAMGDSDGKCGGFGNIINMEGPDGPFGVFNADDAFASVFSNFGTRIDISAPGVNILSTDNDGVSYHRDSGTSMAAPHATGAAALYLVKNPNATPLDVQNGLISIGVPSTAVPFCSGENFGYFVGDTDGIPERMLNVNALR